ncbi:ABC transporter substrate-binding protein [uncultured Intestinimonas sp.]|uniref:ABC transporter substrate-binding protein n=1 Tax=uncultured Intestinimonas sp. TaxID=1689265 RepID=UPI0025D2F7F3|nr:ABC transporter substrate-binding protein [uncultured Intestinimonas sp.]
MKPSRLFALVLALVLLSGCGAPPPEVTPTPSPTPETVEAASTVFTLPRTTASLHPILSTDKVNVALSGLIWEGLFELDQTFSPQLRLCQSYAVSEDGLTCTFHLRSGVTFSDGSPLTAADVVASLQLAQSPQSRFAGRLDDVASIAEQDGAVVVTLRTPNGTLPALLDIPIVKAGSDEVPAGTGPYRLTERDGGAVLTARTDWWRNLNLPAETIPLMTIQAADDLISAFDTEDISLVTADLTGTSTLGFAGDHAVWDYPTTTMVYIGYNCQKGPCANAAVRRALDRAWDRNSVAVALYSRHAQAATLPLHPVCADYDDTLAQRRDYSPQVFAQLLEEAGYAQGEDGLWYQGRQPLSLTFVVNTDNTFRVSVAEYLTGELTKSGVQVELQKLAWTEYQQALTAGSFDLYLGAATLSADFDPAPLLTAGGALNFGGYWNANTLTLLSAWQGASGALRKTAAQTLWTDLETQVPFSTLCFKNQSVLTQWGAVTGLTPTQQNPFYGIENWRFGS